jgi:hypothetical protein
MCGNQGKTHKRKNYENVNALHSGTEDKILLMIS